MSVIKEIRISQQSELATIRYAQTYLAWQKYGNRISTWNVISRQRRIKDDEEISLIQRACEIVDIGMDGS
jgi:Xaa-Pro aminopeptidase